MDKIILGLLMLRRLTVYELRGLIGARLWGICSDSMGSIQSALKKLLAAEMVVFSEYVEKSVNKKRYSITEKGRMEFLAWVQTPARVAGPSTMELGKVLFMGLVPVEKRIALVEEIIAHIEDEISKHAEMLENIEPKGATDRFVSFWETDPEYHAGIQAAMQSTNDRENISDILNFQLLTLQYGIDSMQFQADWFKQLRQKLYREGLQ
jgi:DNA-binding PadR family transcriptional regulator